MFSSTSSSSVNPTQQTQLALNQLLEKVQKIDTDIKQLLNHPFRLSTQGELLLSLQAQHREACIQLAALFINWVKAAYDEQEITAVRLMHPRATANKEKIKIELLEAQIDFFQKNYLDSLSQQLKQSQSEQLKREISAVLENDLNMHETTEYGLSQGGDQQDDQQDDQQGQQPINAQNQGEQA